MFKNKRIENWNGMIIFIYFFKLIFKGYIREIKDTNHNDIFNLISAPI